MKRKRWSKQRNNTKAIVVSPSKQKNVKKKPKKKVVENDTLPYQPHVSMNVFLELLGHVMSNQRNEIGGFYSIDDTDQIVWVYRDMEAIESPGHVVTTTTQAMFAASDAGVRINGDWHTHPNLSTFWSATDLAKMWGMIQQSRKFSPKSGARHFLVIDGIDWFSSRFRWDGEKLFRADAKVMLGDISLDWPRKFWTINSENEVKDGFDEGSLKTKRDGKYKQGRESKSGYGWIGQHWE